jgi:HD-like signal output (HDOD) protein
MGQDIDEKSLDGILNGLTLLARPSLMMDIDKVYPEINPIAELISRDPGVSAAILKVINSPLFGMRREITSVQQAAMLLGLKNVINIVNGVLLKASTSQHIDPASLQGYWQATNDVAVAASLLAKETGLVSADEAYLLGLFHNCGMLVILEKHPDYMKAIADSYAEEGNLTDLENNRFKADHAIIGFYICHTWRLSPSIANAIMKHHDTLSIQALLADNTKNDPVEAGLMALLKLAEHLAKEYHFLGGNNDDTEWNLIKDDVLRYAGIDETDLPTLEEKVSEAILNSDII